MDNTVLSYLPKKLEAVAAATQAAKSAIGLLESSAKIVGLEFDGTPTSIEKLRLVLSLAESAPDDVLYLRHEGLRHPHAHSALSLATNVLAEVKAKKSALNSQLYLDMVPAEADLKSSILVLREGDTWFRIFQGKWRRAVGLHKQLQRKKEKKPATARLAELEEVLSVIQRYESWRTDAELRTFAGPSFKDDETPMDELSTLSGWVDNAVKRLQTAQLNIATFDPISVNVSRIAQIRGLKPSVENAIADLERFRSVVVEHFPGTTVLNAFSWRNMDSTACVVRANLVTAWPGLRGPG